MKKYEPRGLHTPTEGLLGRILAIAALAWLVSPFRALAQVPTDCRESDQIYYNGTVLTMVDSLPRASAVAAKEVPGQGMRISAVGESEEILERCRSATTEMHDLEGKTLIPGFVSSHSHLGEYALVQTYTDVSSVNVFFEKGWKPLRTTAEILEKIRDTVAKDTDPGAWALFNAYDPSRQSGTPIARPDLDAISTSVPILLLNNSGHWAYTNTPGLKRLNICGSKEAQPKPDCVPMSPTLSSSEIAEIDDGRLMNQVVNYAIAATAPTDTLGGEMILRAAARTFASQGYTTVVDASAALPSLQSYVELAAEPQFPVSIVALPMSECYADPNCFAPFMEKFGGRLPPALHIGPIKFWADGSPQGYTALMEDPYYLVPANVSPDPMYRGLSDLKKKLLAEVYTKGYEVAVHVNGDEAMEEALDVLEAAQSSRKAPARPQFIHLAYAKKEQVERVKALGGVVTYLIGDLYYWGQVECQQIFGPERVARINYPVAYARDLGMPFGLHSDAPVVQPSPLWSMWVAVTRKPQLWGGPPTPHCPAVLGPEHRISIEDALRAYTVHGAYNFGLEDEVGSLRVGMVADFAILTQNPLNLTNPDGLLGIKVTATVHRGRYRSWWDPHCLDMERPCSVR